MGGGYGVIDPADAINPDRRYSYILIDNNLTIFLVVTIICIILLQYAISLYMKKGVIPQVVFPVLLILSFPFAFTSLQRGNSVLVVAVLMSIALYWKDDPSKIKRELAMILIAVCAGLKIYPAIFGLMYLKERRFKETVRLVIYGLVLFFTPFVFFGGIDGLRSFIHTLFFLNTEVGVSVSGLVEILTRHIFGTTIPALTFIIQQCFLLFSIISFFVCKDKWGEVLILCCLMAFYISSSLTYTCVYMLPALLMFFYEKNYNPIKITGKNWRDIIGFLLFVIIFTIPYKVSGLVCYVIILLDAVYIAATIIGCIVDKQQARLLASR